jgi:hypothetical protein
MYIQRSPIWGDLGSVRNILRTWRVDGTRECLQTLRMRRLVSTGDLSDAFVSGSQEDNGDERNEQREGTGDVPLTEDDTEVFGGPGEQHLEYIDG